MDRGRRIVARVLVVLGLLAASLSLAAWWAQAVATREFPLLTTMALHSIESAVTTQLQAQVGASGLSPQARQAARGALDSSAVKDALSSGDPGPAVQSALVKADPALAPVLKGHPLVLPPGGHTVNRYADRIRPLAQLGFLVATVVCGLALALAPDRFRVLRRVGWWGVLAGGLPLLVCWALPVAFGLEHAHGAVGSVARAELGVTIPLRGLSEALAIAGAVLAAVGTAGPYVLRALAPASSRQPAPGDGPVAATGPLAPGGVSPAWSSSSVDVRL
jgi:hypothetical protein